jgi:hypothetical protein
LGAQDDEEPKPRISKRQAIVRRTKSLLRRIKKPLIPIACSLIIWASRCDPVEAKMAHEATKSPTYSLRPGMSAADIEDVMAGKKDIKELKTSTGTGTPAPSSKPKASTSKSIYGEDLEDEEDFDLDEEDDYSSRRVATQADLARSKSVQASQTSHFASYRKEKSTMMYVKVSAGVFLPTFGTMFVREHFRQRREEAYVQKGLEILEAQKAEYFNVTAKAQDSDLEDALKGIKNNTTDTDDDDDDDDDDSDDDDDADTDEDPGKRRKGPKPPRGGGDGGSMGGGSGSGSSSGDGDEGVSDEDRDRLKNLFDKS